MNPESISATAAYGFDMNHIWTQSDFISHAVVILLLLLSVASWAIILGKTWSILVLRRRTPPAIDTFWNAPDIEKGLQYLAPSQPFADLARQGFEAVQHMDRHANESAHLDAHLPASEFITRALRNSISHTSARLEDGLTFLASVGSTAPFIGLFGTVWGIYHTLERIGITGQTSLDKVAGPVGEALVMTGAGLFVAIPAVLAYNSLTRSLRLIIADLDAFAYDLHAYFTTGRPLPSAQSVTRNLRPTPTVQLVSKGA